MLARPANPTIYRHAASCDIHVKAQILIHTVVSGLSKSLPLMRNGRLSLFLHSALARSPPLRVNSRAIADASYKCVSRTGRLTSIDPYTRTDVCGHRCTHHVVICARNGDYP